MLGVWDVSQDEKDAVGLVGLLVRASLRFDADPRIVKRAERAKDWLERYNAKHPSRMLRDGAVLSSNNKSR